MTADSTSAPTTSLSLPPGPEGLAVDLECPQCAYNLRGLTTPRCPECGYLFAWDDVPCLLQHERSRRTPREIASALALAGILCAAVFAALLYHPLASTVLAVGLISLAAATVICTFIELMVAMLITMTPDVIVHYFRRWWEGVVIGWAATALAVALLGTDLERMIRRGWKVVTWQHALWLALLFAGMVVIQYVVIKIRERKWGYPVPGRRLLVGIATSKLIMLVVLIVFVRWQG